MCTDPMDYEFTELFDIPKLTVLCESFTAINGTVTALLDLDGHVHIATGWQDICVKFHRTNPGTSKRCTESDTALAGQLSTGQKFNLYKCKNGLVDVAVPVIVDNEHVGNFFTGQFLLDSPDTEFFRRQAKQFNIDEIPYVDALSHVPIFTEDEIKKTMTFLVELTQMIGEMGKKSLDNLRAEEVLRKELENQVLLRTEELQQALLKAEAANEAQNQFVASMSHELRTPLTAIQGYCELMQHEITSERLQLFLQSIKTASNNQLHLVNDILDAAKLSSGKFSLESAPFSLLETFEDLAALNDLKAREKGITLQLNATEIANPVILGDENRLTQILLNLISNAVKFTEKGYVHAHASVVNNVLTITVEDTGIGFEQKDAERLFERYEQKDKETSRRFGGTGLGLSISRSLAELMDGSLTAVSKPGEGSTFTLKIPYQPTTEHHRNKTHLATKATLQLRGQVLVAEDQDILQTLICRILEIFGATVTLVENGQQALQEAMSKDYDLILMDMRMPVMDGDEATRLLREAGNTTPIVALTAAAIQSERETFEAAGCDAFLGKPFAMDELFEVLSRYLEVAPDAPPRES
jgi:signal transduction histidine kinase/ActR/RegA family two-component response regulator